MALMNEKLASVFANDTYQNRFFAGALEQILGEEKTEALIEEILPPPAAVTPKFKGQLLAVFNGLSREQLKTLHGFTDADVDEVFRMMGVTETAVVKKDAEAEAASVEKPEEGETEAEVDARRAAANDKEKASQPAHQQNNQQARGDKAKATARK